MSESLLKLFEVASFSPDVLESLESIMITYALSADDVFFKYESFSFRENLEQCPTVDSLVLFRRSLSRTLQQKSKIYTVETVQEIKTLKTPRKDIKSFELLSSPQFGTSAFSPLQLPRKELVPHKEKGKPKSIFNPHIQPTISKLKVHVNLIKGQQTESYRYFKSNRYMYERLTEKGDLLNQRIIDFQAIYGNELSKEMTAEEQEELKTDDYVSLFAHPLQASQQPLLYVGRITLDSLQDGVKFNIHSILLETSRYFGGARVKLEFEMDLEDFDLYPGQIVCVKGINVSGQSIKVTEVLEPKSLEFATTNGSEFKEYYGDSAKMDIDQNQNGI
jgi:hypothetical protein